jgi:hypothetical protein
MCDLGWKQSLLETLVGTCLFIVDLEEVQGLTDLEVGVSWDSTHHLQQSTAKIEGKNEVISVTRFPLMDPIPLFLSRKEQNTTGPSIGIK